jgi:hypothetical protein
MSWGSKTIFVFMIPMKLSEMYLVRFLSLTDCFLAIYFFEKVTFEEIKEQMITKMIMQIPRLRQRLVHFMGDHYFIDVGVL